MPKSNVHIGFVYPLSTNGSKAAQYTNMASLHAIAGVSKNELAFCASGFASIVKDTATGLIASGFANVIGKDANGAQCAGFLNYTGGHAKGFAAAGFINVAKSGEGAQCAGFANITLGDIDGVQASGFINTSERCSMTQASGFINIATDVEGAQVAGFVNAAHKVNTQVAGFINVADTVEGAQIGGFINIARKVSGVQIAGFMNIADSSDYPIGLINLVRTGELAMGVTVDETGTTIAAFRSGGRKLYGIVGLGINPTYNSAYALQAGLGAHFPLSRTFRFNVEGTSTWLYDLMGNSDLRAGIQVLPAARFGPVELFAGPSFNYTGSADMQGIGKTGYSVWTEKGYYWTHDLSVGGTAGIQFHLDRMKRKLFAEKTL